MRQLVLLGLGTEAQLVDVVDNLAQVVTALDFVFDLAEDFADLIFDGVRTAGLLLEALQVGKEFLVDEVAQVVAGYRGVVVELAVLALGRGPAFPSVGFIEQVSVLPALDLGDRQPLLFEIVEIFEEQQPRGLLGVVEFGGTARLLAEDIVDISECLFEHVLPRH
jgi:hypothetical protein